MKLVLLALLTALAAGIWHPNLWGPDEPREAEIAREVWESGNYAVTHLNTIPMVEKPPLYHDIIAGVFHLTGPCPGAARSVSFFFAVLMMLALFLTVRKIRDTGTACLAAAMLVSMPQFYRAAHWILLDIGVGAFCTGSIFLFLLYVWENDSRWKKMLIYGFYLCAAGAFLTKGLIGFCYPAVTAGTYILIRRKWIFLKEFLLSAAFLIIPAVVVFYAVVLYRQGGIFFLHEHFINNTVGRLLHINMTLPGNPCTFTDVGNSSPFLFYLNRLPNMFGALIILFPFVLYDALSDSGVFRKKHFENRLLEKIVNGNAAENTEKEKDLLLILMIAAFIPPVLLSFSSIKEVTYILPSYAAFAFLASMSFYRRIPGNPAKKNYGFPAFMILLFAIAAETAGRISLTGIWICSGVILLWGAAEIIRSFVRKDYERAAYFVLALLICGSILGNIPLVMLKTRLAKKNFIHLASCIWEKAGERPVVIFGSEETLRGSIPFFGNRNAFAVRKHDVLKKHLKKHPESCIVVSRSHLKRHQKDFEYLKVDYSVFYPPFPELSDQFAMLIPVKKKEK